MQLVKPLLIQLQTKRFERGVQFIGRAGAAALWPNRVASQLNQFFSRASKWWSKKLLTIAAPTPCTASSASTFSGVNGSG